MRERELKRLKSGRPARERWSLPMRERELKLGLRTRPHHGRRRSPCGSVN